MSQTWYGLFLPTTESATAAMADATASVVEALHTLHAARGYQSYDPFPGGTGTPPGLTRMVRLFVAPPGEGWVRVLGQPDETLLPELSETLGPVLVGGLAADGGGFALFQAGVRHDDATAFEPYLRPGQSLEVLQQAFAGELPVSAIESDGPPVIVAGADGLPPELQQLAQERGVDPKKADRLVQRLGGNLFGKLRGQAAGDVGDEQDAARAVFMGGGQDLWNSLHGQRVRAIAGVLNLPANWRVPTWETVRDAYQVHRLRQRSPRMPLMPGDKEAMDAVPDALAYTSVYLGQK